MRNSFSLLELVFVIVIVGIVAGSTFQFMLKIYNSYRYIRDISYLDLEVTNASMILTKYLEFRIEGSATSFDGSSYIDLDLDDSEDTLLWISRAFDIHNGVWSSDENITLSTISGFIDLVDDHNSTVLVLPEENSSLTATGEIVSALSNDEVNISETDSFAIFFKGGRFGYDWSSRSGGYYGNFLQKDKNYFLSSGFSTIYEQFFLSWRAYGAKVENGDLYLYRNFKPWKGETYLDGNRTLFLKDVSEFKYSHTGATVRFRICVERGAEEDKASFCRDSIVY
jgi:hypothetical protein